MAIKKEFGLSLFGFDLIVPVRSDAYSTRSECCCESTKNENENEIERENGNENESEKGNENERGNENGRGNEIEKDKEKEKEEGDDCKFSESSSEFPVRIVDLSDFINRDNECSVTVSQDDTLCGDGEEVVAKKDNRNKIQKQNSNNYDINNNNNNNNNNNDINNNISENINNNMNKNVKENKHYTAYDDIELVVIDVNYFPSYKEVPDFPQKLRKFLRSKAGMD